jgi:hypothetical protein
MREPPVPSHFEKWHEKTTCSNFQTFEKLPGFEKTDKGWVFF